MFIEVTVGYLREDDDTDYEGLGVDVPEDYAPDWEPTTVAIWDIARFNPTDGGEFTFVALKSDPLGLRVKESYQEVSRRIAGVTSRICQCRDKSTNKQVDPNVGYWGGRG